MLLTRWRQCPLGSKSASWIPSSVLCLSSMLFPRTKTNMTASLPCCLCLLYVVHQRWQADPAGGDGKRTLHCMPVACLLATRTTWNELKSWQEKFLITTWLADWHACSSSSMAANGGQQVCVPSTSDLGGAGTVAMAAAAVVAIVSTQRISYILHQ